MLRVGSKSPASLPGYGVRFEYAQMVILGEPLPTWLAGRTPEQRASFENDQRVMERTLLSRLATSTSPKFEVGDPPEGWGTLVADIRGEMSGVFAFSTAAGERLDEVEVKYAVGLGDISSHMQIFGGQAGDHLIAHLDARRG